MLLWAVLGSSGPAGTGLALSTMSWKERVSRGCSAHTWRKCRSGVGKLKPFSGFSMRCWSGSRSWVPLYLVLCEKTLTRLAVRAVGLAVSLMLPNEC
jgi:hypothetical protein